VLPVYVPPKALKDGRASLARAERKAKRSGDPADRESAQATRAEYAALKLAEFITRVVDEAPPLTNEQRDSLALLLRPGGANDAA
jgi:hypothetical protein